MLVLSRKCGQRIVLPDYKIEITVLGITDKKVTLGISAPLHVMVHREELWNRLRRPCEREGYNA
jgi:carbon storage regulator